MIGFLTFYFLTYSFLHTVVFLRLRPLLPGGRLCLVILLAFFLLMIAAPLASRILEQAGQHTSARAIAWIGFLWMGFVFLMFVTSLLSWSAEGGLRILARLGVDISLNPINKWMALAALSLAVLLVLYGIFEARQPKVERITLTTDKLPAGVDHIKIVQISDLHLGVMSEQKKIKQVFTLVGQEKPDLLIATGDLVDGAAADRPELERYLTETRARLGKFAIIGNHEVYAGLAMSQKRLARWGYTVIRNRAVTVAETINLVGVDDPHTGSRVDEADLLASIDNDLYTILLKHRPEVNRASVGRFGLQLSGHTHRGQIFPFNFITGAVFPYQDGLYHLEGGSILYTSRGTGTWGPPVRILAPPEVTVVEIKKSSPP